MAKQPGRILGMTNAQIGILAGLGFLALASLCVVGWLIFSNMSANAVPELPLTASSPVETSVLPAETPTPESSPTPAPTAFVAPAGWKEFSNSQVSLWLPENFAGGDMLSGRANTIAEVKALGQYFANIVTVMQSSGPTYSLWMVDKNMDNSIIISTVAVQYDPVGQEMALGEYIRLTLENSSVASITINEHKPMTILGYEARRLTYQYRMGTSESTNVAYTLKDGMNFWTVTYSLAPEEYPTLLPMIEQSIASLKFLAP
ncbi:MAG: hypothetical protein CO094_12745 [Anaerolineae bacterium CG_4_9_14_3_um_filter_57_17]|nr:hypothetical protein [bacterium]NCT21107.1 hypothetical protein [bacterium]OIO83346.1 MAG: hypothetical protein AUK01_12965 [Anaerolineae bacterium CG2_30_57_67]PJB64530.1 MAG: hypothetical protein CO094_12745 [Anaerolineae bacterium CG_4_9_14_3_um_filter_57_17]